jgi:hypothetical protein
MLQAISWRLSSSIRDVERGSLAAGSGAPDADAEGLSFRYLGDMLMADLKMWRSHERRT